MGIENLSDTVPEAVLDEHDRRLAKARVAAAWELGSSEWADRLIDIYTGHDEPTEDAFEAYPEGVD